MKKKIFVRQFSLLGLFSLILSLFFIVIANSADSDMFFSDVGSAHQYATAIGFLQNNGVIEGYSDGTYKPDQEVNRAEFLKIVEEGLDMSPSDPEEDCFPDVPKDEWYAKYVCNAKDLGWVEGYPDGYFRPAQGINKVEALKILAIAAYWNLSGYENGAEPPFNDVGTDQWYWKYLAYAVDHNIIDDTGDSYTPAEAMRRGQIAEYMYRDITVRVLGIDKYDQSYDDEIADIGLRAIAIMTEEWEEVAEMVRSDIIEGFPQKDNLVAFMWKEPEAAGTKIGAYDLDEADRQGDEFVLDEDAWLVYIDFAPGAMWEHDTMFIFVDPETYEYSLQYEQGWPIIDGYGMWNTDEMRQKMEYWVYPLEKNVDKENMFEVMGEEDEDVEIIIDYSFLDYTFKVEPTLEEILKQEEDRKKAELAALQKAETENPKTKAYFESQCKDLPYCENVPGKKMALVIDGFAKGDGFEWGGLPMYQALESQGYDTSYLSAVVGKNKESFPADQFPKEKYPEGSDEHKDKFEYTTMENITNAFNGLAAAVNSCCDEVVIYIGGHGSQFGTIDMNEKQTKYKVVPDPDNPGSDKRVPDGYQGDEAGGSLHTDDLKALLDKVKSCKVTVIISSCYSGMHIENKINEDFDPKGCLCRTVYTSSTSTRSTYGTSWTDTFAKSIGAGKDMAQSALDAHNKKKDQGYYSNFTQTSSTPPILCSDPDHDGICTGQENLYGTDSAKADTDGDTISDSDEIEKYGTDPKNADTDGDTLSDYAEINIHKTDPKKADTDDDDLNDKYELLGGTDPNDPDSDDDNCSDGREQLQDHTNPLNPDDHAVECGNGISGTSGQLLFGAGETATVAGGSHTIQLVEIYEGDPSTAYILIDVEPYEVEIAQIIPLNGIQIEIISLSGGKMKILIRERTE